MECDRVVLKIQRKHPKILGDYIWKYERLLRKAEYYCNSFPNSPLKLLFLYRLKRLGFKLGFQIPINTIGPGLALVHPGTVLINAKSQIGENCRIQTGVTLGATNGSNRAPRIGNNVFLGDGCKIIGDVSVADGVTIGANAVVTKSIHEPNTTWAGVPAHKISDRSSDLNLVKATEIVNKAYGR